LSTTIVVDRREKPARRGICAHPQGGNLRIPFFALRIVTNFVRVLRRRGSQCLVRDMKRPRVLDEWQKHSAALPVEADPAASPKSNLLSDEQGVF
jgi:hypothetical protein